MCREGGLASRLGARSGHLAYPYGDVNPRVASRAGAQFRYGHTTEFGACDIGTTRCGCRDSTCITCSPQERSTAGGRSPTGDSLVNGSGPAG